MEIPEKDGQPSGTVINSGIDAVRKKGAPIGANTYNVLKFILERCGLDNYDEGKLAQLKCSLSAELGIYLSENEGTLEILDDIANSTNSLYTFDREGLFCFQVVRDPNTEEVLQLGQIGETLVRDAACIFEEEFVFNCLIESGLTPDYRHKVGYCKNYTTQEDSNLLGDPGVPITEDPVGARRSFVKDEYRFIQITDPRIKECYPFAQEGTVQPSLLVHKKDAELLAKKKFSLFSCESCYMVLSVLQSRLWVESRRCRCFQLGKIY